MMAAPAHQTLHLWLNKKSVQVNLLEEQLVWAPMGPPSEAASIVSSAR